jgi:hypothetical protein
MKIEKVVSIKILDMSPEEVKILNSKVGTVYHTCTEKIELEVNGLFDLQLEDDSKEGLKKVVIDAYKGNYASFDELLDNFIVELNKNKLEAIKEQTK